ncbi:uncharacterized protein LOC128549312 [Mercenaria mercenaria]|uniref:uncharacterized protein LOC128549312 n=1 Tax=Mercenaria mercenaria TaxID=6596 RepID=UPI00234EB1AB|nr:uncharacterized protein LOC128549312 [Mercenaria mercenaria]
MGIGVQLPRDVREARKPLYPAMKTAKDSEKSVKFVDFPLNGNDDFDLDQNIEDETLDMDITETELHEAVYTQNNNKSPGTDNLPGEIFKSAYDIMSPFLLKLYNRLFNSSEYPISWGEDDQLRDMGNA